MLKQMLSDDRNEAVREAVTKSLALVVAFIENEDKYEQVGGTVQFNIQSYLRTLAWLLVKLYSCTWWSRLL